MGISTHTKRLTSGIAKATSGLVKKTKNIYRGATKVAPTLKEEFSDKALTTKKGYFGMKRTVTATFKRPISDISHLSIILVVALTLFSGLSTVALGDSKVATDPFRPSKQAANQYVSADERRILEADLVTTLASIHSDGLGADAAAITQDMYQKESNASGQTNTISFIPVLAPAIEASTAGKITKYTVLNGDTLSQISNKFSISTDTVRYANDIANADDIKPGMELTILPVSGILYTTKTGDTISSIANSYNLSEDDIIAQNDLYGIDIVSGMKIVLPDAEIPAPPEPEPTVSTPSYSASSSNPGISYVKTSTGPNHFPWGWCTWWVAQKRYVPWSGNAWQWYYNAQAYGRPVGGTPVPGAILVTWESGYGHVAYVESASGNTFTVSEMNYQGFGIVSSRTITVGDGTPIIGFIY